MQLLRLAAAFILLTFSASLAQVQTPAGSGPAILDAGSPSDPQLGVQHTLDGPLERKMEHRRLKALNKERQDSIKKDTEKLLQLATELKEAVDESTQDTLSLEVVRKTEEIEKLSKSIREKMKDAY